MFANAIGNVSLAVMTFYLLVFCNFTAETLGCNLQHMLRTNIYAKHILSVVLMLFLVIFVNPKEADKNILIKIGLAFGVYFWFLITTRCPFIIMIIVLILLMIVYMISATKSRYESDEGNTIMQEKAKQIGYIQNGVAIIAFILSIIGFIIYLIEKHGEYGDEFSILKFLIGDVMCKNYTPSKVKII